MDISYCGNSQSLRLAKDKTKPGDIVLITQSMDTGQIRKLKKIYSYVAYKPIFDKKWEYHIRHCVEHGYIDYLIGLELIPWRDKTQTKSIAFNHVLAKLCAQHNITILFPVRLDAQSIVRIRGIIQICQKYGVKYEFVSFASSHRDLISEIDVVSLKKVVSRRNWSFINKNYLNQRA